MYQRILVPVDGSEAAKKALDEAIRLAADGRCQLRIVYVIQQVYPINTESYAMIDYTALQQVQQHSYEHAFAEVRLKVQASGVIAETAMLEAAGASVAEAIDREAVRWSADLIVIGTHGYSGLKRWLLGSVSEDVVREAPVPVLLVRSDERDEPALA